MPQPANPPPEDVSGRDAPETPSALDATDAPLARLASQGVRPVQEPLDVDAVGIVVVGTLLWFAGFFVLLAFRGRLADSGREVWLWTCLAGGVLGLIGLPLALRARTAARRARR